MLVTWRSVVSHARNGHVRTYLLVMVLLAGYSAFVGAHAHVEKVGKYARHVGEAARERSIEHTSVYLPPTPLEFLASGATADLPDALRVEPGFVDQLGLRVTQRSLLSVPTLDWLFLFAGIGSLLAILSMYDAVIGERERGTLRLCFALPLSRMSLVGEKFLGGCVLMGVPLLVAALVHLAVFSIVSGTNMTPNYLFRVGLTGMVLMLYVVWWILLSILVSSWVRHPETALMILFSLWILTSVVHRPAVSAIVRTARPLPTNADLAEDIRRVQETSRTGLTPQVAHRVTQLISAGGGEAKIKAGLEELANKVTDEQTAWTEANKKRVNEVRSDFARAVADRQLLIDRLASMSPYEIVSSTVQVIANTGRFRFATFEFAVQRYATSYTEFVMRMRQERRDQVRYLSTASGNYMGYDIVIKGDPSYDEVCVDVADFPRFHYEEPLIREAVSRALAGMAVLLVINIATGVAVVHRFQDYEAV